MAVESDGSHDDQKFWKGQNVFVVMAGGGVVIIPEHHIWGALCIVVGVIGFIHSTRRTLMKPSAFSALWIVGLVLTWLAIGYDYYDRHHWAFSTSNELEQVHDRTFVNDSVILDRKEFARCRFLNVTLVYNGTGWVRIHDCQFDGSKVAATSNPAVLSTFAFLRGLGFLRQDATLYNGILANTQPPKEK